MSKNRRSRGKRYETTLKVRSIANLASLVPRAGERLAPAAPADGTPAGAPRSPTDHTEYRQGGKRPWIILSS